MTLPPPPEKINKILTLLSLGFLLGTGFLMLFYAYKDPFIGHGDSANTAIVARNLAEGNGYTVDYIMDFVTYYPGISHPEDRWPLGLPTFISIFFVLFGVSTFIAKLPNILLFLLFVIVMFFILKKKYNMFIAFFASIFTLVNLNIFNWLKEPYNDINFLILINLCFVVISLWMTEPKGKCLCWLGVLTGLTIVFKPTGLLLIPLFIFIIIVKMVEKKGNNPKKAIVKSVFLFLFITLIVASPWFIRNALLFGDPIFSMERIVGPLISGGAQQDESYRLLFDQQEIKTLKQLSIHEKVMYNFKQWYYFGKTLIKDNIVPSAILFLFLFALVILQFNEFEKNLVKINCYFIFAYLLFMIFYWHL